MLLLLCLLLRTGYIVSGSTIRGAEGESVTLSCKYATNEIGITSMCWGKGECSAFTCGSKLLETDGQKVTWSTSRRYQLKGAIRGGDVSMTIEGARPSDSGIYCCRVEITGWFNDKIHKLILKVKQGLNLLTQNPISHPSGSLKTVQSPEGAQLTEVTVSFLPISELSAALSDPPHRPHNQSEQQNSSPMNPGVSVQESEKMTNPTVYVYVLVPVLLLTLAALVAGFYIRQQKMNKNLEHGRPQPMTFLEPGGLVSALEGPDHAEANIYSVE